MNKKTFQDYIKLANHFLKERLTYKNIKPTEKNIRQALIACATEYRPAYWRRLRCALVSQQIEAGYTNTANKIKEVKNPITAENATTSLKSQKKKKQPRVKTVRRDEHQILIKHIQAKKDRELKAIIDIVRVLGCRPIEALSLQFRKDNHVLISGAKKTESKQRGLDRTVVLTTKDYEAVQRASHFLHESRSLKSSSLEHQLKRLQGRLATVTKKLWPRRKHRISLYSYRHLMGSDLKASGMSRIEIAAVMGHQSVDSVNVYGNRQVSQRSPQIRAIKNSISAVRKNTLKDDSFLRAKKKTVVKEFTFLD